MTVSGLALALAVYVDGEAHTDARFTEALHLIVPAPATWSWVAYRWDNLTNDWSQADVAVVTGDAATVTISLQRPGIVALFAPEATTPSASTWLYLPAVQR
jgi:hypothetical protein